MGADANDRGTRAASVDPGSTVAARRPGRAAEEDRWPWERLALSGPGLLLAAGWVVVSMSPSLLPRTWWTQGIVMGVCAGAGYAVGLLLEQLLRGIARLLELRVAIGARQSKFLRLVVPVLVAAAFVWATVANIRSQADTARLVELTPLGPGGWALALVLGLAVFALVVGIARLLRQGYRRVRTRARRHTTRLVAALAAALVVTLVSAMFTDLVVVRAAARFISSSAATTARTVPPDRTAPTSRLRSGGPGSSESWDSLMFEGQKFVTGAPSRSSIAQAWGVADSEVSEPIRAYASFHAHPDLAATAAAVVAELERTGAFDRRVLAVFTTTGTGWVNEWSAQTIEYLTRGNSAIAAMQYGDLPSAAAVLADRATPQQAGKALFDAVHAAWERRPAGSRPQLVVSGESLGAYGGTAAFSSPEDMLARTQGAVWTGGPSFTPMIASLMQRRTPGSPQILPVIDSGRHIRFSTGTRGLASDEVGRAYSAWTGTKVVFVQHPSDPIVWWNPQNLWDQPDWLRETRGSDVLSRIRWYPFVTFWQLTSDMAVGLAPPPGHGHRYGAADLLPAWEAVLDLKAGDSGRLVAQMTRTVVAPG